MDPTKREMLFSTVPIKLKFEDTLYRRMIINTCIATNTQRVYSFSVPTIIKLPKMYWLEQYNYYFTVL